ncbi:Protein sym1 [Porphyridium purpureum]|uniref:Protein sym1 n=1 Tax=Porphyridium purpureum TaxID=35688 RepID=A0A5J4YQK5_PORPP|nr:Protein sym1 [Porphyridium purpureum]|eukprot:POR6612..scf222_8
MATMAMSAGRNMFQAYSAALQSRPVVTKMVTSTVLSGISECAAQLIIERAARKNVSPQVLQQQQAPWYQRLNYGRIAAFAAFGGLFFAPVTHYWYQILQNRLGSVGTRVLADQALFAPLAISATFAYMLTYDGKARGGAVQRKIRNDLAPTLKMNWTVWVPTQAVNFLFVPLPFRVLVVNSVGLVWNVFLAMAAR